MSKLTEEARGRTCQIRLHGCRHDEGVVACHYPLTGYTGMGMKAPDFMAAWGCWWCHKIVDGQAKPVQESLLEVDRDFLRGILRTQDALAKEGKLVYTKGGPRLFDV